jgi:hypothetical protein
LENNRDLTPEDLLPPPIQVRTDLLPVSKNYPGSFSEVALEVFQDFSDLLAIQRRKWVIQNKHAGPPNKGKRQ